MYSPPRVQNCKRVKYQSSRRKFSNIVSVVKSSTAKSGRAIPRKERKDTYDVHTDSPVLEEYYFVSIQPPSPDQRLCSRI